MIASLSVPVEQVSLVLLLGSVLRQGPRGGCATHCGLLVEPEHLGEVERIGPVGEGHREVHGADPRRRRAPAPTHIRPPPPPRLVDAADSANAGSSGMGWLSEHTANHPRHLNQRVKPRLRGSPAPAIHHRYCWSDHQNMTIPHPNRTSFRGDPASGWPHFKHPHEVGGRPGDCQNCGSPRIAITSDCRLCASCGYEQKPSDRCLACHVQLNARSLEMRFGLCTPCRRKSDEADTGPSHDWIDEIEGIEGIDGQE